MILRTTHQNPMKISAKAIRTRVTGGGTIEGLGGILTALYPRSQLSCSQITIPSKEKAIVCIDMGWRSSGARRSNKILFRLSVSIIRLINLCLFIIFSSFVPMLFGMSLDQAIKVFFLVTLNFMILR